MLSKIFNLARRYKRIVVIGLFVIIASGYFGCQRLAKDENITQYATAAVEKGTLIVSISGSGQASLSDQADIKPKVSGDLAAFYIAKGREIEAGQLLAVIDTSAAQRAVNDAEITLENARMDLEELFLPIDAQSLLQAENALAQAERDLEIAKRDYENIEGDVESILSDAYEDGYSDVSTSFFKLSNYMEDLQGVLGTEQSKEGNIDSYELILGENFSLIERFINDYYRAENLYSKSFAFFGGVFRDDDCDKIYQLINDVSEAAIAISRALESARHMYDAIDTKNYHEYYISFTVDSMRPVIESDLSGIFSTINSLQNTLDIIDDNIENTPDRIKDAELKLRLAEEKLAGKKIALEEINSGVDSLDIRAQQNIVAQKEAALADSKAQLADHYIYAPFSAIVAELDDGLKIGDAVSSGSVFATLITKQKIAEITLNEIDIAKVKIGQKANIAIDAIEGLNITGEVIEIDTLGSTTQGVVTYGVKIAFDTQNEQVKPGMSLSASIIIDVRQNVLLVPNSALKQQAGAFYVEIESETGAESNKLTANISDAVSPSANNFKMQPIQIGLSNDTMTEILDGLAEGDLVVTQSIISNTAQSQNFQGNPPAGGMMRMMR